MARAAHREAPRRRAALRFRAFFLELEHGLAAGDRHGALDHRAAGDRDTAGDDVGTEGRMGKGVYFLRRRAGWRAAFFFGAFAATRS